MMTQNSVQSGITAGRFFSDMVPSNTVCCTPPSSSPPCLSADYNLVMTSSLRNLGHATKQIIHKQLGSDYEPSRLVDHKTSGL